MEIDCYTDSTGFQKLERGWEALLDNNKRATIFQTPEWNRIWWENFRPGKELMLLAFAGEGISPAGIAPLYSTQSTGGQRVLRIVGGIDLSDYLDLIYHTGHEEPLCMALLSYLRENRGEWDALELHNVPADSPTLTVLKKAANEMGFRATAEEEEVCPYIPLPSTWDDYLSTLGKKDRHELRRKMRKAGREGGDKRYVVGGENNLSMELDEFFRLHRKSGEDKKEFMEDGIEKFFHDFSAQFHERGWLDLSFLEINEQRAASLLSFKYRGRVYLYNSGFDPAFSSYSAGIALMGQSIKDAIEEGYQKYDFLRGSEGYKYRLGAQDVPVYKMNIYSG